MKSDPLRKLIPLPEDSHLPFDISKTIDVLSFSFVSKPFFPKFLSLEVQIIAKIISSELIQL